MILDQLIEKKDVFIYIDVRIKHLQYDLQVIGYTFAINNMVDIFSIPLTKKELKALQKRRDSILSRIRELKKLKSVISEGKLKSQSKIYWKQQNHNT